MFARPELENCDHELAPQPEAWNGPLVRLALAWMGGITLGTWWAVLNLWLVLAVLCVVVMVAMWIARRRRAVRCWGYLAVIFLAASWGILRSDYAQRLDIARYVSAQPQLVQVTGRIAGPSRLSAPGGSGLFAQFSYREPSTFLVLHVESILDGHREVVCAGNLQVRIAQADHCLRSGQKIVATGWLRGFGAPMNPGELDYRRHMLDSGIAGRLTLKTRGNYQVLAPGPHADTWSWSALRHGIASSALSSLRLGMEDQPRALGLLETLLLGRWNSRDQDMVDAFCQVGLAHVLSISGAHLGILLGLVWVFTRLFVPNPSRVAMIVLIVLVLYLMAVPMRVPMIRAAIMVGLFAVTYMTGRHMGAMEKLALAALIVLLWRPMDLFSPGFELSFVAVAALLLYTRRVARWIWEPVLLGPRLGVLYDHRTLPAPKIQAHPDTAGQTMARFAINYLAVSVVAFLAVIPLVAYHFQIINPLAVVMSVLVFPVLVAVLGTGYLKILAGMLLPSVGIILSGVLAWLGETMLGLVDHASQWPGVVVTLARQPSPLWVMGAMGFSMALLSGRFARRRLALSAAAVLLVGWLVATEHPTTNAWLKGKAAPDAALVLNMFAVGDGACYLVRLDNGKTLMFDCGSQANINVARRSIVPALKHLGVAHIDMLFLSHANMDHYVGSLDLVDQIQVDRVLVSPQFLSQAQQENGASPVSFLIEQLTQRGLRPQAIARGWHQSIGDGELDLLWPEANFVSGSINDSSLVLSIRTAGRRLLLNGDIQQAAITQLLAGADDLKADVTDLPHHGSFTSASPHWFAAVQPSIVLQSTGPQRLQRDRWATLLQTTKPKRFITARDGMVELRINKDGHISAQTFLQRD